MFTSKDSSSSLNVVDDDDELKRILLPVLSSKIPPLRASLNSSFYRDHHRYENLFLESCAQIRREIELHQWPFSPIYLLHINNYCHINHRAIPAEIALVETTFWPQLYNTHVDITALTDSQKILDHYERHLHTYNRFSIITDDFHDFVHPGDQLPTGYQADILEHSRRTHEIPCTPYEKIGSQDYNQLLDDLHEMLNSLVHADQPAMPMFCTMESFLSTKAALDWLYDQPSTRDRIDDYTLYPIESLIAVIYENFYHRSQFRCDLNVLMGKTPQQPILQSRACDYHSILENKFCAMAHVRDIAKYFNSLMAYLFYTYSDSKSSQTLPYIKQIYQGNLYLQQQAFWSSKQDRSLLINHQYHQSLHDTYSTSNSNWNFDRIPMKKTSHRRETPNDLESDLNPLAVPFGERKPASQPTKTPVQLVLFEPSKNPSRQHSCPIIHQRLHRKAAEDWDRIERF